MNNNTVLKLISLSAGYGEKTILQKVNASVEKGEIRVILGGSGCGKTTLLKTIIGLLQPISGEISLLNHSIYDLDRDERSKQLQKIGVLFQNGALIGSLSVAENVALPLKIHTNLPQKVIDELVLLKLDLVNMADAASLFPAELSGGMKKRVALSRAMIMDPEILFCDEPSAGLDPLTAVELDNLILSIRKLFGIAIVVVTHELMSINTIADNVLMLADSTVIFDGSLTEAKQSQLKPIKQFFTREADKKNHDTRDINQIFN